MLTPCLADIKMLRLRVPVETTGLIPSGSAGGQASACLTRHQATHRGSEPGTSLSDASANTAADDLLALNRI
jgi:hypothetical protein